MENANILVKDCYKSISAPSKGIYKDNGSKFLSFAFPVESESEIKTIIFNLKKEYFDARHHCYAYRLGYKGDIWRINDDGEPSSTAGRPIYGQLLSNELSDVLIIVVRYFGGIKLGVPGLIKAYKSASSDAIANSQIIEKTAKEDFRMIFDYEQMNSVMRILKEMDISPLEQHFDNECSISAKVRLRDADRFAEAAGKYATVTKIDSTN